MKKNDIKAKISNLSDIQDKFFYISILNLLDTKNYINLKKENMIFLKPNFKYLIPNDYINRKNYDIAFFYNLKDVKKINYINSKEFISSGYPYLIIVRDNGEDDNIIIIEMNFTRFLKDGNIMGEKERKASYILKKNDGV